jgi:hypothetical protein
MALTVTNITRSAWRDKAVMMCDVAFDSSYAYGGESFDYTVLGMSGADRVIIEDKMGYAFEFDYTNKKIKVFQPAPPIVVEEQQTIATNAVTLNYPAAYIMAVAQANAAVQLTDPGATLAANQCQPTAALARGERTGLTFHAGLSGVVYVTYVTQAWQEVWDNLVQSEEVTITGQSGHLTYNACAIMSVRSDINANASVMIEKDDTVASGEVLIDFTPASGNTLVKFAAGDCDLATVTYVKKPSSGFLLERFVEEELSVAGSNICTPAYPILMYSTAGYVIESGQTSQKLINIKGTLGTDEAYINFWDPYTKITSDTIGTGELTYIKGWPHEIKDLIWLESINGANLSDLTDVKVTVVGH